MHRIKFIAIKEFYHILRDIRSLIIAILMPILMTFLYGYAISLDIKTITLSVLDFDQSRSSQDLIDDFYKSNSFVKPEKEVIATDPEELLLSSEATAVLVIKDGFEEAVNNMSPYSLGMLVDGSDNNLAAAVQNYSNVVINRFMLDRLPPEIEIPQIEMAVNVLYNPNLESSHFFVPGLVAVILMMISALLTSITIAREKETGTMEQLLTSPATPFEIIGGKIIPYIFLALLDGFLVLLFAWLLFDIPFVGSKILLLGFGLVYVATSLAIGILISSLVRTQQVAMMLALVVTLLPSIMLSGFIFAVKNMPVPLQIISNIIPAKYFIKIIRGIMLKGAGFEMLIAQSGYLLILMVIFIVIASKKFTTRIA